MVDDDATMVEVVSMLLSDAGLHACESAESGETALERLAAHPFELLVCDLNMPGMDGIRLLGHVASLPDSPAIILLSGEDPRVLDVSRQYAEAKGLRILGVLGKPVDFESLLSVLQRYDSVTQQQLGKSPEMPLGGDQIRIGLSIGAPHLAYQPKVDLNDGSVIGVEALLRWEDEQLGCVPAPEVVRAAENADLIDALTLAVLTQVVHDRAALLRAGIDINIAFNVSMHNLRDLAVIDRMSEIIATAHDRPDRFTIEVTETHLMDDMAHALEALICSRLKGFKIAIDDYGTGAATMQYLMQLPSTELKIDRSFVAAAPRSEQGRVLLQSAIELGIRLGQSVIVEGVETEAEARIARELGCHFGQGHFFAWPMPLEELIAWMPAHAVNSTAVAR